VEESVVDHEKMAWTNPSVLRFAAGLDPIDLITLKAKDIVMRAIQEGWEGPPFDPFKLASLLKILTIPKDEVLDARILPTASQRLLIEFNPSRPSGRTRFSIAHEIAHSLFPDCIESARNRSRKAEIKQDDWQLELLCDIAASEFLMPTGGDIDSATPVNIDNLLRLQRQFDVSTEAIATRLTKITSEPCTMIAVARVSDADNPSAYRLDYSRLSRTSNIDLSQGLLIKDNVISQCTAVGYTAKGKGILADSIPELYLECVGIPPYPGRIFPRVIGIAKQLDHKPSKVRILVTLRGNALSPRGTGLKIIAHVVNDKTASWGAGFGHAIRTPFPTVQEDFKKWCATSVENLSLGNIHVSVISENLWVVSMIAQHGYGESSKPRIRYAALRDCLIQLKEIALNKAASIHMPRIGTGYAGGNWSYISEMIDDLLVMNAIPVTIYILPENDLGEIQGALALGTSISQ